MGGKLTHFSWHKARVQEIDMTKWGGGKQNQFFLFYQIIHTILAWFSNLFKVASVNHPTTVAPLKPQEPEGRLSVARAHAIYGQNGKIELEFRGESCKLQAMIYGERETN